MAKRSQTAQAPAGANVEKNTSPQSSPNLGEGDSGVGAVRVHYFTKEALAACAIETVALEQAGDLKYGHRGAQALVAMTLPLPEEAREKYASAFAPGTRLLTMQIDKDGTAHANYNSVLNAEATECVKAERRAQIETTLKEFPEIKNVVITVEGEAWR